MSAETVPNSSSPERVPGEELDEILDAYDDAISEARSVLLRAFRELDEIRSENKKKLRALFRSPDVR